MRAAAFFTVGALALTGLVGIAGFYLAMVGVVTIDQIAEGLDTARRWHASVAGSYGASLAAIAAHYYRQWRSAENALAFQSAVQQAVSALVGPVGQSTTGFGGQRGNR